MTTHAVLLLTLTGPQENRLLDGTPTVPASFAATGHTWSEVAR